MEVYLKNEADLLMQKIRFFTCMSWEEFILLKKSR